MNDAKDQFRAYIADVDKKSADLKAELHRRSDALESLHDVRSWMTEANIQYELAMLNWKSSEFDNAIARMERAIEYCQRLPNDLSELPHPKARPQAESLRKHYPFFRANLAYYYAERYRHSGIETDATRALDLVRDLPNALNAVSEPESVHLIDAYLFVMCSVRRIDPPLKQRFRDLFDSHRESLRAYLLANLGQEKGQKLYEEYGRFANS